jgi:hypothetical protein
MKIIYLIYYILFAIVLFFIKNYLYYKNNNKTYNYIIPIIYIVILSAIFSLINRQELNESIYLTVVFEMLLRSFYNIVILDNKDSIEYIKDYILVIVICIIINILFINSVDTVIPDGESLKIIVWILIIIYIYSSIKDIPKVDKNEKVVKPNLKKREYIITKYAKFKTIYNSEINVSNKKLKDLIYSMMIYEDNNRNKYKRSYDNYFFGRLTKVTKLGIMQVESKVFITDKESIIIVCNKINKLYKIYQNEENLFYKILNDYYKDEIIVEKVLNILNVIIDFNNLN